MAYPPTPDPNMMPPMGGMPPVDAPMQPAPSPTPVTSKKKDKEPSDDIKMYLKAIADHFDDEDRAVRDRQIRQWRRLKLLWENIQNVYYSEVAHDWRIPESERSGDSGDQGFYDKPVNIFRAYLESIIAALSITVPPVTCYPDDADKSDERDGS